MSHAVLYLNDKYVSAIHAADIMNNAFLRSFAI